MQLPNLKFDIWDLRFLTTKVVPILISLALTLLICKPLFQGIWYPMHDSTHVARVALMTESIKSGEFPPLWADRAGNGYGYPLFHFYAPLFHLSATIINFFVNNIYLSLKIILTIATFIGAYGMYRLAGVISVFAYLLSPYLAVNLYVRGAFSEYLALMLLPWVFYSLKKLSTRRSVAVSSILISLFMLSHNLIPPIVLPFILLWGIYWNKRNLFRLFTSFLLAFLLSSWFILPVLFERGFTKSDEIARTTNYSLHFVAPSQLWNSTWGFGGSTGGIEDGMSFKLGKLQIFLALAGLLLAVYYKVIYLVLLGGFGLVYFILATPYSQLLWDKLTLLQIVQFPWRALGPLAFILAVLVGNTVYILPNKLLKFAYILLALCLMLYLNLKYFVPQSYEDTSTPVENIVSVIPEYQPVNLKKYPVKPADPIPNKLYGPAAVSLDRAYYPTWKATLDDKKVELRPSVMGLVELDVPVGEHDLTLTQSRTNLELAAYALTLFTLGVTFGLLKERA